MLSRDHSQNVPAGSERSYRVAVLTLSDKGAQGIRDDESGRLLQEMVRDLPGEVIFYKLLPDEAVLIEALLCELSDRGDVDVILTTGGTGVSLRDVTPDATLRVIDREVPGMAEAMRAASLKKTSRAMISRAVCGIRKQTLIINLPGSPRGARENLTVLLPALPHAIDKIRGDQRDCAST
ncbi:MAG: molybdenum cofactor biosynthesis protein [Nitrospirae bacterium CG2_30_53_67]|nr:MAG: molybdenum cofactor biosynthesis protein [Nitrospirae bacterium CG2_30_53_67]